MSKKELKYKMTPEQIRALKVHFDQYQDRGMVKWQGFMLSEHNAQIERLEGEANKVIPPKPQMEQLEMDRVLNHAYTKHIPVKIQLNASTSDKGVLVEEVTGWLLGDFDHDGFSLDSDYVFWKDIRHVELTDKKKWSSVLADPFEGVLDKAPEIEDLPELEPVDDYAQDDFWTETEETEWSQEQE